VSDPVNCGGGKCVSCADLCGAACLKCAGATPVCDGTACVAKPGCASDSDCSTAALPACQPDGTCGECSASNDVLCKTGEMCRVAGGVCEAVPGGCKSDADCKLPAAPACGVDGVCHECSAKNSTLCAASQVCKLPAGECDGGCASDADCDDPALPACLPDGSCGECSATNHAACDDRSLTCHVASGTCATDCATDADCTDSSAGACLKIGVCGECSATNTKACIVGTQQCNIDLGQCVTKTPVTTPPTATIEGSGISCALSPGQGALGSSLFALLAGVLFVARRRRAGRR
jgi:hypothetical protein